MHNYRPDVECPNHVVIGVPDTRALDRVRTKLDAHGIPHFPWHEPDGDLGFTAIATAPLRGDDRKVLGNYRLLKHGRGDGQPSCSFTADAPTNSRVV